MIGIQLEPVDTLFFRDGTPFTAESAPQENVGSLFPPYPPTVVGALRAALARSNGWNGNGRWPQKVCEILGNGPENLGTLSFVGPFLLRDEQPLFRAPRHLLGSTDGNEWRPSVFLRPGAPVTCDLGDETRLPEPAGTMDVLEKLKAGDDCWLTRDGMNAVLRGRLPRNEDVTPARCLWSDELRIGLERDSKARTAKEGMLYSTRHVRPMRGVSLGVRIAGLSDDWTRPFGRLVSLGGENRLAECRSWDAPPTLQVPQAEIESSRQVTVVALSPLDLERDIYCGRQSLEALGARVVSACLHRPQRIGGWDSSAHRPLPLRSTLPPGSVLFCEIDAPERFTESVAAGDGLASIGARQEWGFGLVAIGGWPDEQQEEDS